MRVLIFILTILFLTGEVYADTLSVQDKAQPKPQPQINPLTVSQNVSFENCTKIFGGVNKEKLFYLTLSAINANNFTVEEIQTTNGYIIFKAVRQNYLALIAEVDNNNSILKITPCNNIYFFQPGIVMNIFKYIDLNKTLEIK